MAPKRLSEIYRTLERLGKPSPVYFDEMERTIRISHTNPWGSQAGEEWSDHDDTRLDLWLQEEGCDTTRGDVQNALGLYAVNNSRDPLKEHIERLMNGWDGTRRIHSWIHDYCGAPERADQPKEYVELISKFSMRGFAARALYKQSKVDSVLVLEGNQGKGKSTICSLIGGPFYSDSKIPMHNARDAASTIQGSWLHELGEMASASRADVAEIKAFVSSQVDVFKPPYGRRRVKRPRRVVFIATINESQYLVDTTGNRRWWPVWLEGFPELGGKFDLSGFAKIRDQLLGEAANDVMDGNLWHPSTDAEEALFAMCSDARRVSDPLEDSVAEVLSHVMGDFISSANLLKGLAIASNTRASVGLHHRVARIMAMFGWRQSKRRVKRGVRSVQQRGYVREDREEDSVIP